VVIFVLEGLRCDGMNLEVQSRFDPPSFVANRRRAAASKAGAGFGGFSSRRKTRSVSRLDSMMRSDRFLLEIDIASSAVARDPVRTL